MLAPPSKGKGGSKSRSGGQVPPAPINWSPRIHATTDFIGFCNSLDIINQALKENVKVSEHRPIKPDHNRPGNKTFVENLGDWVDTFKNTESTLDKDKRKAK